MMFKTFKASSLAEVFRQVREAFGPDAVVVSTKASLGRRWIGVKRELRVEVTAVRRQTVQVLSALANTPRMSMNMN